MYEKLGLVKVQSTVPKSSTCWLDAAESSEAAANTACVLLRSILSKDGSFNAKLKPNSSNIINAVVATIYTDRSMFDHTVFPYDVINLEGT